MTEDFKKGIAFAERRLNLKVELLIRNTDKDRELSIFIHKLRWILWTGLISETLKVNKDLSI